jgi:hypothetical protein
MKDLHLGFDSGYIVKVEDNKILHNCNTNPGCSGGAIIEKINNSIIGMHQGFYQYKNNIGIFVKYIIDDIKNSDYFKIIENDKINDLNSYKKSNGPWNKSCDACESVKSEYPCPCENCLNHSDFESIKWNHINCGGYLRLYENGIEKCQKCGKEDLFCNWFRGCQNAKLSSRKIRAILQYLIGASDGRESTEFWMNITACLEKQEKDYPHRFII